MDAIKTEADSDLETQSVSLKSDFEFVSVNYEQDPVENTHNMPETKDALRDLMKFQQDDENKVITEEYDVFIDSKVQKVGFQGDVNCEGIYSLSHGNMYIIDRKHGVVERSDVSSEAELSTGTSAEINNHTIINKNTCDVKSSNSEACNRKYGYHTSTHNRKGPYTCQLCSKAFLFRSRLQAHMRTHTGEKPYACKDCNKSFSQKVSVMNHLRMHTGEKPYSCKDCNKRFSLKISLINHFRIHTGEIPYTCDICGKIFSLRSYLVKHIRTHTDKKVYQCTLCNKSFIQRSMLTSHFRSHTGEKPYKCSICSKAFSRKQHMDQHISRHTGEKPYRCEICNKEFFGPDKMIDKVIHHIRSHPGLTV